jgi:hypothetical protein
MPKENPDNRLLNATLLRYLVNFWTIVFYGAIIGDFATKNGFIEFLGPLCVIYVALLATYTTEKEFERWHDYNNIGRHPGEFYVIGWTILVSTLFTLQIIYHHTYHVPETVFTTYVVVMGILAITKRSKSNYGDVVEEENTLKK